MDELGIYHGNDLAAIRAECAEMAAKAEQGTYEILLAAWPKSNPDKQLNAQEDAELRSHAREFTAAFGRLWDVGFSKVCEARAARIRDRAHGITDDELAEVLAEGTVYLMRKAAQRAEVVETMAKGLAESGE